MTEHAKQRAKERYGIDLSNADLAELRRQIREKKAVLIAKMAGGRTRHIVMLKGVAMIVVAHQDGGIITALPRDHSSRKKKSHG